MCGDNAHPQVHNIQQSFPRKVLAISVRADVHHTVRTRESGKDSSVFEVINERFRGEGVRDLVHVPCAACNEQPTFFGGSCSATTRYLCVYTARGRVSESARSTANVVVLSFKGVVVSQNTRLVHRVVPRRRNRHSFQS